MKSMRLIINYFRFTSRIVLVLLILSPALARGLEDKIVFVFKRNVIPDVVLVEGLNGRPIQLTRNRFARWPSISPDGNEVVFVSHQPGRLSNIFKLHIATGKIDKLTDGAELTIEYRHLDWAPDGRQILFMMISETPQGEKSVLCVMDMKTRDIRHILQAEPRTYIWHLSWSPDSQHILYAVDHIGLPNHGALRELFITDDNGNQVIKVEQDLTPLQSLQALIIPTWSPRRSQIAYLGFVVTDQPNPWQNPWQIYSMNLDDGMVTAVTSGGAENRFPLAWSPDGRKILFAISSPFDEKVKWADT